MGAESEKVGEDFVLSHGEPVVDVPGFRIQLMSWFCYYFLMLFPCGFIKYSQSC